MAKSNAEKQAAYRERKAGEYEAALRRRCWMTRLGAGAA